MEEPLFDIFSGKPDSDPLWLETVEGLDQARKRMEQRAAQQPGSYFIFSTQAQAVLAEIEATEKSSTMRRVQRAS